MVRSMVRPPDSRSLQDDVGFERPAGLGQRRQLHGDVGLALGVGDGQLLQRLAHGADLLVGEPELEAGKARHVLRRRLDDDLAFDGEAGGRRTVEVAAGELDGARLLRASAPCVRGLELELEPLGHEVLDQERGLRDRSWPWGRCAPWRARCRSWPSGQRQLGGAAAQALVGQRDARMLDAVGAREDDA